MNILFVTSNRIGDAVLSTGLLGALIDRHPGASITIACGPLPAPLFAAVPGVRRVISLAKRRYGLHWLSLWAATLGTRWDEIIDLRASTLAWFLYARQRRSLRTRDGDTHRVRELSARYGLAAPAAPRIWITHDHRAAAARLIPDGGPVLGVGPTANWAGKIWPADRFNALIARLTAPDGPLPGARVAVFGGPDERALAAPVLAAIDPIRRIDLVGAVDLLTAYACLARLALYVGNDSALMHLAAASGVPTLGLFGPSRETVYGPWGENAAAVRTPETLEQIVGASGYDRHQPVSHMTTLTVDAVEAAAARLLAGPK